MKSLIGVPMGLVLTLLLFSCATVPTEPLGKGELRLLKINVPEHGNLRVGISSGVEIIFEADGEPEISRAICHISGEGPFYYKVRDVTYGSPGSFSIDLSAVEPGLQKVECYAHYVRDGKTQLTNPVFSKIFGVSH